MAWDVSNRQILIDTLRGVGLWLAIAVPVFFLAAWVIGTFPNLPRGWHGLVTGVGAVVTLLLYRWLWRRFRRAA